MTECEGNLRKAAKELPEIIIPEGLEKMCAAIYEPTVKSR